ncbi:MAG: Gfo/Idh/MocA family oxidoreductase [Actinobacteria bacterium]|nr:MAG: Gfo/Idh/MocA family oxidoreductase [Actinomycetota bacterium]
MISLRRTPLSEPLSKSRALQVLVIGAGSIGRRHAANLAALGAHVEVTDPVPARAAAIASTTPRRFDLDDLGDPDAIVIASPTQFHALHLRAALATGARILVEKPLALPDDDLDGLVAAGQGRVMVGYNLRLHEPLVRLVDSIEQGRAGEVVAARLWFGSWLPDWRPRVDYRDTYSARRDLGGGVLLDAIHELDEAVWLWGHDLEVIGAFVDRVGPLEIDVEDTVHAILRTATGVPIDVALDYLSRRYRRGVEVVGAEATIRYDWSTTDLTIESAGGVECCNIDTPIAESYEREADRFVQFVIDGTPPPVDATEGAESVRLAARILHAGAHRTKSDR